MRLGQAGESGAARRAPSASPSPDGPRLPELRFNSTSTISAVLGQTSQVNVAGGPSCRIGGPEAQASSKTRGEEPGPPPPGSIRATPSAAGSPPLTLSVRR